MTYSIPLVTRCTVCRETIFVHREKVETVCGACGTPALIWLIDPARVPPEND